jgi:hypothetical protein
MLLTRTHMNVKVANNHLLLKCGRRVTGEVTLQILTSFGGTSSTDEFLIYFDCILTIIDVVIFTGCFSLQDKYKEEVIKKNVE